MTASLRVDERPAGAGGAAGDEGMRARIMRAAAALFRRQGFERTTMQQIAAAVGLTKAALYHHVTGKQALLFEILQHTIERSLPELERIAAAPLPADERLRRAARLHVLALVADLDNVACFIEEGRSLAPEYSEAYLASRDRYESIFRRIIADGIAASRFAPADVQVAGFAILGMVNWVVRWYRPDGRQTAQAIADQFGEYAVRALAARGPVEGSVP
jgi:AcrR family transcriptional regulator